MNKRGYTLVEVIVSIMILSIASITLAGAFSKVIHFMSKSNDVKNASDSMYAYAEGDTEIDDVNVDVKETTPYFIDGIEINGSLLELSSNYSEDVLLKNYSSDKLPLLKDDEEYISLMDKVKNNSTSNLIQAIKDYEKEYNSYDLNEYNNMSKLYTYYIDSISFFKNLLPMEMSILRSKPLYIRIAFPWQEIENYNIVSNGSPLILITDDDDYEIKDETQVYLIYYEDNWYCYNTKNMNSPYFLENRSDVNHLKLYKQGEKESLSFIDFQNEVLSVKNDEGDSLWQRIEPRAIFDGVNSKHIWKNY